MVKWKTDFESFVVNSNFERRGWTRAKDEGEDWDIYWANINNARALFAADSNVRLEAHQIINHFPNHYEITRKDLLVKNVKRHLRQARKDGSDLQALDFLPTTYILPQDYSLFVEEFRKQESATWIMKPSGRAQGQGIFLINKLSQIRKWAPGQWQSMLKGPIETYVVSRYIDNPLLIGGKKFDLRLYVVVLSYKPLKAYLCNLGFARFCNIKYTAANSAEADISNPYVHLTNVSIQRRGEEYNEAHGNKWPLSCLLAWIQGTRGEETAQRFSADLRQVILESLRACQNIMINDRHCFEMYGYDIIVDEDFKPWLIEVNASPSLTSTTPSDRLLKARVIHDTLRLATPPEWDPHSPMPALTTQDGPSNKSLQAEREGMSSAPGRGTGSPVMSRTASLRSQTSLRGSRPERRGSLPGTNSPKGKANPGNIVGSAIVPAQGSSNSVVSLPRLPHRVGSMELLCDETQDVEQSRARRAASLMQNTVQRPTRRTVLGSMMSCRPGTSG